MKAKEKSIDLILSGGDDNISPLNDCQVYGDENKLAQVKKEAIYYLFQIYLIHLYI